MEERGWTGHSLYVYIAVDIIVLVKFRIFIAKVEEFA